MRSAVVWLVPIICAAVLWPARVPPLAAQTRDPVALSGQVTSAEEGPMEGVLVSAQEVRVHGHDHGRLRSRRPVSLS